MIRALARDRNFWAAVTAALFFWCALVATGYAVGGVPFSGKVLLLGVLVYPMLEEATFRGLLQGLLLKQPWAQCAWKGWSVANGVTSAFFSAAHLTFYEPLWAAAVFAPSMLFGYFRDRYGGIGPSILLHAYYNLGWLLLNA